MFWRDAGQSAPTGADLVRLVPSLSARKNEQGPTATLGFVAFLAFYRFCKLQILKGAREIPLSPTSFAHARWRNQGVPEATRHEARRANVRVKICKDSGPTISQSKSVKGENYIVVNYRANSLVTKIWVLWDAQDGFFSPRKPNTNARSLLSGVAAPNIELLFSTRSNRTTILSTVGKPKAAKAILDAPRVYRVNIGRSGIPMFSAALIDASQALTAALGCVRTCTKASLRVRSESV